MWSRTRPADTKRVRLTIIAWSLLWAGPGALTPVAAEEPSRWRPVLSFEGHDSQIWCVAFSPDGKIVASGSGGYLGAPGQLKLWEAATGQEVATANESRSIRWIDFSPDGTLVATAEHDGTAKLRDTETLQVLRTLRGHESGLDTAVFSPDGKHVATTSWDQTVRLWDSRTGDQVRLFNANSQQVYTVAFRRDGREIATGGQDHLVRLWNVETGRTRRILHGHEHVVHCVAWSPDGRRVASASWDKSVRLWDSESGRLQATFEGHTVPVLAVAFSPDGALLASVSGRWGEGGPPDPGPGELILWDMASGRSLQTSKEHTDRIFGVAFSPDGKTIATASWDGSVKLWRQGESPEEQAERAD